MQTQNFRVHAILKTLSALHIAAPSNQRLDTDGSVKFGTNETVPNSAPCVGIQRYALAPNAVESVALSPLPVIAANNIAGHLRRHARDIIGEALKAKGKKINLQTYSALSCGAVTGSPDMRDMSYAEYIANKDHVYIGAFGGGPRMARRRIRVHNALPVMAELRENQLTIAHPNPGTGRPVAPNARMTGGWTFRRVDDISALGNLDLMDATIENCIEVINERQALIAAEKKGDERSKYSTKSWSAFEFVLPGLDFDFTVDLMDMTPAQIGLFLKSLSAFANEQIGGKVVNGLGRIALIDVVMVSNSKNKEMISDIFRNNQLDETVVKPFMDALAKELDAIDESLLMELLEAPDPAEVAAKAEEKKAKKAAGKSKA